MQRKQEMDKQKKKKPKRIRTVGVLPYTVCISTRHHQKKGGRRKAAERSACVFRVAFFYRFSLFALFRGFVVIITIIIANLERFRRSPRGYENDNIIYSPGCYTYCAKREKEPDPWMNGWNEWMRFWKKRTSIHFLRDTVHFSRPLSFPLPLARTHAHDISRTRMCTIGTDVGSIRAHRCQLTLTLVSQTLSLYLWEREMPLKLLAGFAERRKGEKRLVISRPSKVNETTRRCAFACESLREYKIKRSRFLCNHVLAMILSFARQFS